MFGQTQTSGQEYFVGVSPTVKPWIVAGVVGLLLGAIVGLADLDHPLTRDEIWHWPALLLFGGGVPSVKVLASYYSGPGPLPYIIWGNLDALGVGLPVLRATSMLFLLLSVLGLVKVAKEMRAPSVPILVAFILVQPYILTTAFLLMTDCLALALAVWALYGVLAATRTGYTKYWILAGVATGCVLYTRIPYLSIPIGLGLAGLTDRTRRQQALATAMLSIAAVGPLIALWGGVSSLTMRGTHYFTLYLRHFNHLLAWLASACVLLSAVGDRAIRRNLHRVPILAYTRETNPSVDGPVCGCVAYFAHLLVGTTRNPSLSICGNTDLE